MDNDTQLPELVMRLNKLIMYLRKNFVGGGSVLEEGQ